jgi:hypothetical protein
LRLTDWSFTEEFVLEKGRIRRNIPEVRAENPTTTKGNKLLGIERKGLPFSSS